MSPESRGQVGDVSFFDPETNRCPFAAYDTLREAAPVWKDPTTGMYVLTLYEDVRMVLLDTERFANAIGNSAAATAKALRPENDEQRRRQAAAQELAERLEQVYRDGGWIPSPALDSLDEPRHRETRQIFEAAFRADRIASLEPYIEELADRLLKKVFAAGGGCDLVEAFSVPLPLFVIGRQMGVPEEDMPLIKEWTDAWVQRLGLMLNADEQLASAAREVEAQQYFQPIIERLRREPDDTVLSTLVNTEVPEWGRPMNENELHAELMGDMFVAGAETTTNALSAGAKLLAENPAVWRRLKEDREGVLPGFVEEVIRLESPVQGLLREALVDVELHGVRIPAGSVVNVRFGAANRDGRRFECPADIDVDRDRVRSHLGFGTGTHHCLGAHLARLELRHGFNALLDQCDSIQLLDSNFEYQQNFFLRAIKSLPVVLEAATSRAR